MPAAAASKKREGPQGAQRGPSRENSRHLGEGVAEAGEGLPGNLLERGKERGIGIEAAALRDKLPYSAAVHWRNHRYP